MTTQIKTRTIENGAVTSTQHIQRIREDQHDRLVDTQQ